MGFPTFENRHRLDAYSAADIHMHCLDPLALRNKLKNRVPFKPEQLAMKARKYLTLAAEYARRSAFRKRMADELKQCIPVVPYTHQSPCVQFESGRSILPGFERYPAIVAYVRDHKTY